MWINICAIYFYLLYIDINRLKFPDAWFLYNILCINNFIYIYNYIPNIIIYIIKQNIIIKQIYSNIPKKRRRFLDPFNLRVKTSEEEKRRRTKKLRLEKKEEISWMAKVECRNRRLQFWKYRREYEKERTEREDIVDAAGWPMQVQMQVNLQQTRIA